MPGLKLNHVSKSGHRYLSRIEFEFGISKVFEMLMLIRLIYLMEKMNILRILSLDLQNNIKLIWL